MNAIDAVVKQKRNTYKNKRFIINDIVCIGYSIIDNLRVSILFAIHQDLFDKYEYMNINVTLDNEEEMKMFVERNKHKYIEDMKKDPASHKKLKALCQHMTSSNLYRVDLDFKYLPEKKFYVMKGIRNTGKDLSEIQEYQINDSIYIQLRLFKEHLLNIRFISNDDIFNNIYYKIIKYHTAIYSKLDGTKVDKTTSGPRLMGEEEYPLVQYTSHYTFQCGKYDTIKANYFIISSTNKQIREPMDNGQYGLQFAKDPSIKHILRDDNEVILLIQDPRLTQTDAVRIKKNLLEFTNFIDPENYIFIDPENPIVEPVIPHLKF